MLLKKILNMHVLTIGTSDLGLAELHKAVNVNSRVGQEENKKQKSTLSLVNINDQGLVYNFIALESMCKKLDKFIKFPLKAWRT